MPNCFLPARTVNAPTNDGKGGATFSSAVPMGRGVVQGAGMEPRILPTRARFLGWFFPALLTPVLLLAQNPDGTLQVQVSDPSGAAVQSASVIAISSSGQMNAGVVHTDCPIHHSSLRLRQPRPIRYEPETEQDDQLRERSAETRSCWKRREPW